MKKLLQGVGVIVLTVFLGTCGSFIARACGVGDYGCGVIAGFIGASIWTYYSFVYDR